MTEGPGVGVDIQHRMKGRAEMEEGAVDTTNKVLGHEVTEACKFFLFNQTIMDYDSN